MTKIFLILSFASLLVACEATITGEASGKYEVNANYSYSETVNGKVVKEINSKSHTGGGFETEFNIIIGNGDTTITQDEIPTLHPKITCHQSLSDQNVESLKAEINRVFMDKSRLITAKIAINDWCLTSNQTRDILALFTMDKYRLDFAKFAYGHTSDRINFARVKDAFNFEDSKQKLDNYINTL